MGTTWKTNKDTDWQKSVLVFSGGYNSSAPVVSLAPDQSSDEEGWSHDRYPGIHTRKARVRISDESIRTTGEGQLLTVYQNSYLVRAVDGKVQLFNGTSWSDMIITGLNTTGPIDAVNFEVDGEQALIVTDGTNAPLYWYPPSTTSALTGTPPTGRFIVTDTVRVWMVEGDIMHFSARLNAEDWTTANNSGFIQAYTPQGGDATGLVRYRGRTMLFKPDYIAEIHGTNYFEFSLVDISNQIGTISHLSIAEVKGILCFLGYRQVYAHGGGMPEAIGDAIRHYLDRINYNYAHNCFGVMNDNGEYALGLVLDEDTTPSIILCYNLDTQNWRINRKDEINIRSVNFKNVWYLMDQFGNVYQTTGYSGVSSTYISMPRSETIPEAQKEYFEMHLQAKLASGSEVEIYASPTVEGDDFVLIDTIDGDAQTYSTDHIIPLDTVSICHWVRFKFVATGEVEIYSAELYYNLLPVQH